MEPDGNIFWFLIAENRCTVMCAIDVFLEMLFVNSIDFLSAL